MLSGPHLGCAVPMPIFGLFSHTGVFLVACVFSSFSALIFSTAVYSRYTMVKVEIVDEKEDAKDGSVYADSSSSRTGSSESLESTVSEPDAETFFDRIAALVDIVPPTTRYAIASRASKTASVLKSLAKVSGNVIWIVTTSALLVGLPLALSLEDEAKIVAQEKEIMAQQQGAQQVSKQPSLPAYYRVCSAVPTADDCSRDTCVRLPCR